MFKSFVDFVREIFNSKDYIPLHEPKFLGNEKKYLLETIDSTFVSSVGRYVDSLENKIARFSGSKHAIATVNGTAALHVALKISGVVPGDIVLTQSLTFVATCNAIRYCEAEPVFIDVDLKTLSICPESLKSYLSEYCEVRNDGFCWNKINNKIVRACLPMHTFGFPAKLEELIKICEQYSILLIEDAAESLGSTYKGQHVGTFGKVSVLSFNGNKIITTGGGGMVLTNNDRIAEHVRHITTTAKIKHRWEFYHDEVGYNYRMPNINAALGVAQMESIAIFIDKKRELARKYQSWGSENGMCFLHEPDDTRSNYWLNTLVLENIKERDAILEYTNSNNVMTRPVWRPMHELPMNKDCWAKELKNTEWLSERIVNVPSSVIVNA